MPKNVYEAYLKKSEKREKELHLPPQAANKTETESMFDILEDCEKECVHKNELVKIKNILSNFVPRGSYEQTFVKAQRLYKIITGERKSFISKNEGVDMLLDMQGGAADTFAVRLLSLDLPKNILEKILTKLSETFLVSKEAFDLAVKMAESGNDYSKKLLSLWANASWEKSGFEIIRELTAVKVGDNITTDHLSPGKMANTRTDKPLHATYLMEGRVDEADFLSRVAKLANGGEKQLVMVGGKNFGEGSSRKSATFNLLEVIGKKIEGEPDRKEGGFLIAKTIAPIFENSIIASGIAPIKADTDGINEGDTLLIDIGKNVITNKTQDTVINFEPISDFAMRKIISGGMNAYMAKKVLLSWAIEYIKKADPSYSYKEIKVIHEDSNSHKPQTITQKLFTLNRFDGRKYTEKNESVEVKIRGVFSQDTTGPMTYDEYLSMSGGATFGCDFVVQSLCHTCECPTTEDRNTQKYLSDFCASHGGVSLKPGEGIIHTIGNRFVLPTDIIVGGDSHTRSERGISFPAGSDIVASAMKYGFLELTLDDEVKVTLQGKLNKGITARDIVSMFVLDANKKSKFGKDVYIGSIVEINGVKELSSDERYILTNAIAERSSTAAVIAADDITIENLLHDYEYLKKRYERGDKSKSLVKTIENFEEYLKHKTVLTSDEGANYKEDVVINLADYKEPLVAKPHHPDNIATLSEVAGTKIDEVFIGSCVGGNIESIRAAAKLMKGKYVPKNVQCIITPASEDIYQTLMEDGTLAVLHEAGAVIGIPSCGLCMGNKRRIGENATAFTTTTRNFQSRIGPASSGAYLGSAEIAALTALRGEIVSLDVYMEEYTKNIK